MDDSRSTRRLFVPGVFGAVAVLSAVLSAIGFAISPPAQSTPDWLSQFNSKYETSGTKLDSCNTCHQTGESPSAETLNPYGVDFATNDHDFAVIEPKDSDGDGVTNIDEIKGDSFPGDPADKPSGGQDGEPAPPPSTTTSTTTTTTTTSPLGAITDILGL